jgi:hypothetical protein
MIDLNKIGVQEMSLESQQEVTGGFGILELLIGILIGYILTDLAT